MVAYVIIAVVVVVLAVLALSVRILKQYERAVLFRLGRVRGGARGPGLIVFIPFVDRVHRVSLRIVTMPIQSQGIITRDNVSVDVSAVAYYRVEDTVRSVVAIENVSAAINQIAQTTLRAVVGRHTLDETLSETDAINQNIREILDVQTEEWGMEVTVVELKDIQLPESMKRAMARQAEAEREKRAKIIAAEGESLAAGELAHASDVMMAHPLALQLRNLQTLVEISRRQELHGHLPGSADEHDRGAGQLPQPRGRRGREPARAAYEQRVVSRAPAILAEGVGQTFGDVVALDGLDLQVEAGHRPRAARPQRRRQDDDRAHPDHAAAARRGPGQRGRLRRRRASRSACAGAIGLAGQYAAVDENLTGRENLEMFGRLYHLAAAEARGRADELLERFELADAADRLVKTYSGGMRRRLDLAAAPDRPAAGALPRRAHHRARPAQPRWSMWDVIDELRPRGHDACC